MKTKSPACMTSAKLAGIAAFGSGLFAHAFGMLNIIHNTDNISVQPTGYGTGIASGRWLLTILGDLFEWAFGGYNLSWFNGVVFLLLLSLSAAFLVSALDIRRKGAAILTGMLFVTFPTITATLFYAYTTIYYGIAILLSVLGAYLYKKCKYPLIPSALCTAFALGIYQGYLPLTAGLLVLMLLRKTLSGKTPVKALFLKGVHYCASLALGLVAYFGILKLALACYNVSLGTYQDIDQMGKLSLTELPALLLRTVRSFFALPFEDYCNLAQIPVLKLAYGAIIVISALMILYILIFKLRNLNLALFTLLLCCAFPVAVNLIVIMCPTSRIYTLMVYAFVLLPVLPLVILETLEIPMAGKDLMPRVISGLLIAVIVSNIYLANVNYTAIYYGNRQAENYINGLIAQVRMTDGFDTKKQWAFIGNVDDPLLDNRWQDATVYAGSSLSHQLVKQYSWKSWIYHYIGYTIPLANTDTVAQLSATEEVQAMPCWPNDGSIAIVDDIIVIKFENEE